MKLKRSISFENKVIVSEDDMVGITYMKEKKSGNKILTTVVGRVIVADRYYIELDCSKEFNSNTEEIKTENIEEISIVDENKITISNEIKQIINIATYHEIEIFLCVHGWDECKNYENMHMQLFEKDGFTILVPYNKKFIDYNQRLHDAMKGYCEIEEIELDKFINDIKNDI